MLKNHLALGYVLLVGIPLLILIGVLQAGAGLTAPPAVSGKWVLEPAAAACGEILGRGRATLNITQSGPALVMTFEDARKTTLTGTAETGRLSGFASAAGCGNSIRLQADITGNPSRRSLRGQLIFDGCGACPQVAFRAGKLQSGERK